MLRPYEGWDLNRVKREIYKEWTRDVDGSEAMDYSKFFKSMFEIVDLWTISLDESEYIEFLKNVYDRITARVIKFRNGRVIYVTPYFKTNVFKMMIIVSQSRYNKPNPS